MQLTIATRQSPLALWQANFIKNSLLTHYPDADIRLLELVTKGDKILDTPLAKIGGKGLFVKELEEALYDGRADLAVHSLKDVPMALPAGLTLAAYCKRHSPTDAFVSNTHRHLSDLPTGAVVGTSSLRRECQLRAHRPDLIIKSLRGNVGTRLAKLDNGDYDAIVLATSGLTRLGLSNRICHELDPIISLPAVGQGILGIECRDEPALLDLLSVLDDRPSRLCAIAERAMNHALEGGCQVPIAGYATFATTHAGQESLSLTARVGTPDGNTLLHTSNALVANQITQDNAAMLGTLTAEDLLSKGAGEILQALYLERAEH